MMTALYVCSVIVGQSSAVYDSVQDFSRAAAEAAHRQTAVERTNPPPTPPVRPHRRGVIVTFPGEDVRSLAVLPFPAPLASRASSRSVRARSTLADARRLEAGLTRIAAGDRIRRRDALAEAAGRYLDVVLGFPGTKEADAARKAMDRLGAREDEHGVLYVPGR